MANRIRYYHNIIVLPITMYPKKIIILQLLLILLTTISAQPCPNNCAKCTNPTTCTTCILEYYININSMCSACPVGCSQCVSSTYCVSCMPGYVINSTANVCVSCGPQCVGCQYNETFIQPICTQCVVGTYYENTA
jgi:hypothetical protein